MSSTNVQKSTKGRAYSSSLRARQAAETRSQVLLAAIECFSADGYAGTTLAAVAERAGVAVETVYSRFRSKKRLLREAFDVAVAGDTEPVAFVDRPEFASFAIGTPDERLRRAIQVSTDILIRTIGLWTALVEAASSDPEIAGWRTEIERMRRTDVGRSLEVVTGTKLTATTIDLATALIGADLYRSLTGDFGWSRRRYEQEIAALMKALLPRST